MHFTPWPFWLRIVSTATVVLPVLRSPMISSRWPRPIGVMASMALMPVCSGSCTGWRPMMPGAWTSRRRVLGAGDRALAVDRLAERVDDPAEQPSPTGTERMRPVALTVWPSSIWSASPRTTAPIDSSSRFRARPRVPPSNSSSSLTARVGQAGDAGDAVTDLEDAARPGRLVDVGVNPSRLLAQAAAIVGG